MFTKRIALVVVIFQFFLISAYGQQSTNLLRGQIMGVVRDFDSHTPVASATATLYSGIDSAILDYSFTTNSGIFEFKSLPVDTTLWVNISHIGYNSFKKYFRVTAASAQIDLGDILLSKKDNTLPEVVVLGQRPPMVMRGDTLEINAEAFKTKENAVVEDLLRKVPGIVVWADGKITVNGKSVSQLLVEGKPFFGGDPVIAIRNLPKDAINKIKVYDDKTSNVEFEVDPKVIVDITLKKGKKEGLFGKAGGGIGTDQRYEGNFALNMFTPKNQLSLFTATNNTNKDAYTVSSMLKQSVYKPGGNDNTFYQSNFFKQGLNQFKAGGISLDRDWSKTTKAKAEYFIYDTKNSTKKNIDNITSLEDGFLKQQNAENGNNFKNSQWIKSSIKDIAPRHEFYLEQVIEMTEHGYNNNNKISTSNSEDRLLNKSNSETKTKSLDKKLSISAEYINKSKRYLSQNFRLKYKLETNKLKNDEQYKTTFDVFNSNSSQIKTDRKTFSQGTELNQSLYGEINLLSGKVNTKLINTLEYNRSVNDQSVNKYDVNTGTYTLLDPNLTNTSLYYFVEEKPGLAISFFKEKRGVRDNKQLFSTVLFELQTLSQTNHSQKLFQQINRNYISQLPSFNIRYNHEKAGKYNRAFLLNYITQVSAPSIYQLAPLIDSANQNYMFVGNSQLTKQYGHELKLSFFNNKANNGGSLKLDFNIGLIRNKMVDSSVYDNIGRQISYTINANGYRYAYLFMSYEKYGKLFKNPLGIKLYPRVNLSQNPYFINGEMKTSRNLYAQFSGIANYNLSSLVQFDLSGTMTFYQNAFKGTSGMTKLNSFSKTIEPSLQLSWPNRVTFINSFNYNMNKSSYNKNMETFIWNMNIYYRLLKKENLELKFTAADLLKQRSNLIRYINNNTIGVGEVNNLQRFFMVSLAYYPRQFGFKR